MEKILIMGSMGMAGHVIYHYLKENSEFIILDIAREDKYFSPAYKLDITDFKQVEIILEKEKPDIVINCIGILNKDAEDHPDKAILLNSYLPHFLAKEGDKKGFKLIHISTDCVFSGKKGSYTEESVKDGVGFYAQSKALGEVTYNNHLTLRTSIIGPELKENGIGLFGWFMKQSGNVMGYSNAIWTGITTIELAKSILSAINQDLKGLHHVVNNTTINKYNLLFLFKEIFCKDDINITAYDDYKVDKSLIRTNSDFKYQVPSYREMLTEMKVWINAHKQLYTY